jgi:hypothetical protein
MPTVKTAEDYQLAAAKLASRARKDKAFRKALLTDPVKTLGRAGIGVDAVRELINEDAFTRGRFGSAADGDCPFTCACSTGCCVTCWIGSSARANPGELVSNPAKTVFGAPDARLPAARVRDKLIENLISKGHITTPR